MECVGVPTTFIPPTNGWHVTFFGGSYYYFLSLCQNPDTFRCKILLVLNKWERIQNVILHIHINLSFVMLQRKSGWKNKKRVAKSEMKILIYFGISDVSVFISLNSLNLVGHISFAYILSIICFCTQRYLLINCCYATIFGICLMIAPKHNCYLV